MNAHSSVPVTEAWLEINDGVMGGISTGQVSSEDGVLVFAGNLSLENKGGFVSARRPVDQLPPDTDRVAVDVRGDGRRYQFRIRQDSGFDGVSWSHQFPTSKQWRTLELPLARFEPVFRGRPVHNAGPVIPGQVRQIGFLLADKTPGPFRLEVRSIDWLGERQDG